MAESSARKRTVDEVSAPISIQTRLAIALAELFEKHPTGDYSDVEDRIGLGGHRLTPTALKSALSSAPSTSPYRTLISGIPAPRRPLPATSGSTRSQRLDQISIRTAADFPGVTARGCQTPNLSDECQIGISRRLAACLFEPLGKNEFACDYEASLSGDEIFEAVVVASSEVAAFLEEQGRPFFAFQGFEDRTNSLVFRLKGPSHNDFYIVFTSERLPRDLVARRIPFRKEYLTPQPQDFTAHLNRLDTRKRNGIFSQQLVDATPSKDGHVANKTPLHLLAPDLQQVLRSSSPPTLSDLTITQLKKNRNSSQDIKRVGFKSYKKLLDAGPPVESGRTHLYLTTAKVVDRQGKEVVGKEIGYLTFAVSKVDGLDASQNRHFARDEEVRLFRPTSEVGYSFASVGVLQPERGIFMQECFRGERRIHKDDEMAAGMVADSDLTERYSFSDLVLSLFQESDVHLFLRTVAVGTNIISINRETNGMISSIQNVSVYAAHAGTASPKSKFLSFLLFDGFFQTRTSFDLRSRQLPSFSSPPHEFSILSNAALAPDPEGRTEILRVLLTDVEAIFRSPETSRIYFSPERLREAIDYICDSDLIQFFGKEEIESSILSWQVGIAPLDYRDSKNGGWRELDVDSTRAGQAEFGTHPTSDYYKNATQPQADIDWSGEEWV